MEETTTNIAFITGISGQVNNNDSIGSVPVF